MNNLIIWLYELENSGLYLFCLFFVGFYPLFGLSLWIVNSLFYYFRREKKQSLSVELKEYPKVSVIISAFNEEKYINKTLKSLCALDYPNYEVVAVNDGSTDETLDILMHYARNYGIRVISKEKQQGKAQAMNDTALCVDSEILLFSDADAELEPHILQLMVQHFHNARVAAVAGNPRIKNTNNFLCRLQALEYASIIGMIRRAQRIWGRILTFSGVIFAIRKTALNDAGGFNVCAPTEDIDLAWKLQTRFWDIFYEPSAVAWIHTPETWKSFFKQRLRWARGLAHVIHSNINILFRWKYRRMWPVLIENFISQLWVFVAMFLFIIWLISIPTGYTLNVTYVPLTWGVSIATLNLIGQSISISLDKRYDPQLSNYYPYMIFFPIYYWIVLTFITFLAIPHLFFKQKPKTGWRSER